MKTGGDCLNFAQFPVEQRIDNILFKLETVWVILEKE